MLHWPIPEGRIGCHPNSSRELNLYSTGRGEEIWYGIRDYPKLLRGLAEEKLIFIIGNLIQMEGADKYYSQCI